MIPILPNNLWLRDLGIEYLKNTGGFNIHDGRIGNVSLNRP